MQVHKIQNNNTSFGVKLVVERGMFPHGNMFDGSEKELLQKLISTVESKTAGKKGTLYVSDRCADIFNSNKVSVYFKDGKYTDSVILYDWNRQDLRKNTDKYIDTLLRLTDVFKMREKTIKTTQKAQKQIEKLENKVYKALSELGRKVHNTLPERKTFSNSLFEDKKDKYDAIFGKYFQTAYETQRSFLA